jgi:N-acetylglutamate synthase-like GNAT family acetyltransferase
MIRDARAADADRLAELSGALGYPVESEVVRQRIERILSRPAHMLVVAETADGVVGWIHAAEQDVLEAGRSCEILGLVVADNQRGLGIGRALVEAVERWAMKAGLKEISVRSNIVRAESHPFYEQLGFVRLKTQHVYRKKIF